MQGPLHTRKAGDHGLYTRHTPLRHRKAAPLPEEIQHPAANLGPRRRAGTCLAPGSTRAVQSGSVAAAVAAAALPSQNSSRSAVMHRVGALRRRSSCAGKPARPPGRRGKQRTCLRARWGAQRWVLCRSRPSTGPSGRAGAKLQRAAARLPACCAGALPRLGWLSSPWPRPPPRQQHNLQLPPVWLVAHGRKRQPGGGRAGQQAVEARRQAELQRNVPAPCCAGAGAGEQAHGALAAVAKPHGTTPALLPPAAHPPGWRPPGTTSAAPLMASGATIARSSSSVPPRDTPTCSGAGGASPDAPGTGARPSPRSTSRHQLPFSCCSTSNTASWLRLPAAQQGGQAGKAAGGQGGERAQAATHPRQPCRAAGAAHTGRAGRARRP